MFKIVPMEGQLLINGERQKAAADMLAEAEIALALSALRGSLGARLYPQHHVCDHADAASALQFGLRLYDKPAM